jgi:hypothetical protein
MFNPVTNTSKEREDLRHGTIAAKYLKPEGFTSHFLKNERRNKPSWFLGYQFNSHL